MSREEIPFADGYTWVIQFNRKNKCWKYGAYVVEVLKRAVVVESEQAGLTTRVQSPDVLTLIIWAITCTADRVIRSRSSTPYSGTVCPMIH